MSTTTKRHRPGPERPPLSEARVRSVRETFAELVAEARKSRGLGRKIVARLAGVSPKHLAEIENKTANPSLEVVAKLAYALDIRVVKVIDVTQFNFEHDELRGEIENVLASVERLRQRVESDEPAASNVVTGGSQGGKTLTRVPLTSVQPSVEVLPGTPIPRRLQIIGAIKGGRMLPQTGVETIVLPEDAGQAHGVTLHVTDDSLRYAGLAAGDLLIVNPDGEVRDSSTVVAELNGEIVVGRYRTDDDTRRIEADDPARNVTIRETDHFRLVGVLHSVVRVFEK